MKVFKFVCFVTLVSVFVFETAYSVEKQNYFRPDKSKLSEAAQVFEAKVKVRENNNQTNGTSVLECEIKTYALNIQSSDQYEASQAIDKLAELNLYEVIVPAVNYPSRKVQTHAIVALGNSDDVQYLPLLVDMLESPYILAPLDSEDEFYRNAQVTAIVDAIGKITASDFGDYDVTSDKEINEIVEQTRNWLNSQDYLE